MVGWNGTLMNNCLSGKKFIIFSKSVLCLFLSSLRAIVTWNEPGSTLYTTISGPQSCYIIVKRFGFLSNEWKLAITIDISIYILNWFWTNLKKVSFVVKRQKKNLFVLQKDFCAPGTQTRIVDIDNRLCWVIEMSVCAGKACPNSFYLDKARPQKS